jgi:hypothetical protein
VADDPKLDGKCHLDTVPFEVKLGALGALGL